MTASNQVPEEQNSRGDERRESRGKGRNCDNSFVMIMIVVTTAINNNDNKKFE